MKRWVAFWWSFNQIKFDTCKQGWSLHERIDCKYLLIWQVCKYSMSGIKTVAMETTGAVGPYSMPFLKGFDLRIMQEGHRRALLFCAFDAEAFSGSSNREYHFSARYTGVFRLKWWLLWVIFLSFFFWHCCYSSSCIVLFFLIFVFCLVYCLVFAIMIVLFCFVILFLYNNNNNCSCPCVSCILFGPFSLFIIIIIVFFLAPLLVPFLFLFSFFLVYNNNNSLPQYNSKYIIKRFL